MVIDVNIVPKIYEMLLQKGIPLVPVDNVESEIQIKMECPSVDLQIHIDNLKPKFLLIETIGITDLINFNETESQNVIKQFFSKNKSYLNDYLSLNPQSKSLIHDIEKISIHDIGFIDVGIIVDGVILSASATDEWFNELTQIIIYFNECAKLEEKEEIELNNKNWYENLKKEAEESRKEKDHLQKEKEDFISVLEKLSETDEFQNLKTSKHVVLYWEKQHPNLYKILSRTFVSKLATKLQALKTL